MDCSESKFTVASGFTPSKATCPRCGTISKRHSIATRQVKDINLDHETTIKIKVGVYKCKSCDKHFRFQPGFVNKGKHYSKRVIEKARVAVAEDKTTFSGLKQRLARDFNVHPCKTTGYYWFHNAADKIDMEQDYEKWAVKGFSGVLAIDELYDGYVVLVATDPINDKTISVKLCNSASAEEMKKFMLHLKEIGINPDVVLTDLSSLYNSVPKEVWPESEHQLCIFHYTRLLTKRVLRAVGSLSKSLSKNKETKDIANKLWKTRYSFVTRPENLTKKQQEALETICAKHGTIRMIRQFMVKGFALFEPGQTKQEAVAKRKELVDNPLYDLNPSLKKAVRSLRMENFLKGITFLGYDNCPRTTNHVERANRFYRKRAKTHYRNRTKSAIWNMIKSDLMVRKKNYAGKEGFLMPLETERAGTSIT